MGSVLEPYDTDKLYPVYGFGAKLKDAAGKWGQVQHCFPVYGGGLEVQGVAGIQQVRCCPPLWGRSGACCSRSLLVSVLSASTTQDLPVACILFCCTCCLCI